MLAGSQLSFEARLERAGPLLDTVRVCVLLCVYLCARVHFSCLTFSSYSGVLMAAVTFMIIWCFFMGQNGT